MRKTLFVATVLAAAVSGCATTKEMVPPVRMFGKKTTPWQGKVEVRDASYFTKQEDQHLTTWIVEIRKGELRLSQCTDLRGDYYDSMATLSLVMAGLTGYSEFQYAGQGHRFLVDLQGGARSIQYDLHNYNVRRVFAKHEAMALPSLAVKGDDIGDEAGDRKIGYDGRQAYITYAQVEVATPPVRDEFLDEDQTFFIQFVTEDGKPLLLAKPTNDDAKTGYEYRNIFDAHASKNLRILTSSPRFADRLSKSTPRLEAMPE